MSSLIEIFEHIRDIPYRIPLSPEEEDFCCSGKVLLLKHQFDCQNIVSRYRVCTFWWSDMSLPETLTHIPHEDHSTHVYLEVYIDNTWINIDPTWDDALDGVLPVARWDGTSSAEIAVPVRELLTHEESKQIMEHTSRAEIEKDLVINGEFYRAFNAYLESLRIEN